MISNTLDGQLFPADVAVHAGYNDSATSNGYVAFLFFGFRRYYRFKRSELCAVAFTNLFLLFHSSRALMETFSASDVPSRLEVIGGFLSPWQLFLRLRRHRDLLVVPPLGEFYRWFSSAFLLVKK